MKLYEHPFHDSETNTALQIGIFLFLEDNAVRMMPRLRVELCVLWIIDNCICETNRWAPSANSSKLPRSISQRTNGICNRSMQSSTCHCHWPCSLSAALWPPYKCTFIKHDPPLSIPGRGRYYSKNLSGILLDRNENRATFTIGHRLYQAASQRLGKGTLSKLLRKFSITIPCLPCIDFYYVHIAASELGAKRPWVAWKCGKRSEAVLINF